MGITYLIIGCFFLLNPNISIIDILPDFIGYAFILKGLVKLSKLSEDFETAYRNFRTLIILSGLRILTLPLISGNDQTWVLLMVFCFGLVEAYFSFRAFNAMFEGFSYTAQRGESSAVFGKWSETKLLTIIFVIAKQALCILPELSLLSSTEYGEVTVNGINSIARFRPIFTVFAAIISLAFGIYWFIRIRSYLKGIRADKTYMDSLEAHYSYTVGENASVLMHHAMKFSMTLLAVAAVCSIELPFDGFNYLPHTISALLILFASKHIIRYFEPQTKQTFLWSIIFSVTSAIVWIYNLVYMRIVFGEMFDSEAEGLTLSYASVLETALMKDFFAIDGWVVLVVLTLIEAIIFGIMVHKLCALLNTILLKYTPKKEEKHDHDDEYDWEEILPKDKELAPKVSYLRVMLMKVSGFICAACGPIQVGLSSVFPAFWLVAFLLRVLWVFLFYSTVSKAKELEQAAFDMEGLNQPPHDLVK